MIKNFITLEAYKPGWRTFYFKYNPEKWCVSIEGMSKYCLNIKAFGIGEKDGQKVSSGLYSWVSIRNSEIPEYVKDVEIWD